MKMLLGTKIYMLYWRNYVKSGCAIAGLHCMRGSVVVKASGRGGCGGSMNEDSRCGGGQSEW